MSELNCSVPYETILPEPAVGCDLWPLQRKREATDSDGEATTTPSTPSAEDVKKEKKKKKEKRAKLEEEAGLADAGAEPDDATAELQTEVSEGDCVIALI